MNKVNFKNKFKQYADVGLEFNLKIILKIKKTPKRIK